jgi:predicted metal-dependent hydrolase
MSKKSPKIAQLLREIPDDGFGKHYAGYFACFNHGLFFEAHDVLEELWLKDRRGKDGDYFKGLIQLAGAFVHLQKGRLKPAIALFLLARRNLSLYPEMHHRLDLVAVLKLIDDWMRVTETAIRDGIALPALAPRLELTADSRQP